MAKAPEGEVVWRLIEESGVKRRFVAKRMGISYGYLNQVEYGHAPITSSLKERFAAYFGRPVEELFPQSGG